MTEQELRIELERAYRCICAFSTAHRNGELLSATAFGYHAPTIAAARRFVVGTGELDGSEYFIGKPVEVLHDALKL